MAIVTTSALISDISGKIGGSVFQRTQGGLIMRSEKGKIRNNTNLQSDNKIGIKNILNTWFTLTQSQRAQWNQYAVFRNIKQKRNPSKEINGHQIFIRENNLRYNMRNYGAIFTNPIHSTPLFANPTTPIKITSVDENVGELNIHHDISVDATKQGILLWISRPIRQSQTSKYIKRTMIKTVTINGQAQIVTSYYTSVYGRIPQTGEYVSIEIGLYDNTVKTFTRSPEQLFQVT